MFPSQAVAALFEDIYRSLSSLSPPHIQLAVRCLSFAVRACEGNDDLISFLDRQLDDCILPVLYKVFSEAERLQVVMLLNNEGVSRFLFTDVQAQFP
jgi:hypothetical protein